MNGREYLNHLRELRAVRLKAKLIAATLSHREYLKLRNTLRVVRQSGAPLDPEQEKKVKEFEAVVAAYQTREKMPEANG